MTLEERGRDLVVYLALDGAAHDRGLVLAGGEDEDLARLEDRGHPHGERFARHVLLTEEVGGRVLPGHQVERHHPGPALGAGAGLVEADVAGAPDAEELEVDAARRVNCCFEAAALRLHLLARHVAAKDVDVRAGDVEPGEQILPHEPMVRVDAPGVHRVVLVQVEADHVREAEPLVAMHPDELAVDPDRGRAGGQAEHGAAVGGLTRADHVGDPARDQPPEVVVAIDDDGWDALDGHGWLKGTADGEVADGSGVQTHPFSPRR